MHPLPPPIQGIRCSTTSPATSATARASLRARPNRYLRAAAGRTARHCMTTPTAISTRTAGGNSSDSPSSDDSHTALPSLSPVWRQRPRCRETNNGLGDRQSQLIDAMTSPPGAQGGWRTPPAAGLRPRPGAARRSGGSGGRRRPPHDAPKAAVGDHHLGPRPAAGPQSRTPRNHRETAEASGSPARPRPRGAKACQRDPYGTTGPAADAARRVSPGGGPYRWRARGSCARILPEGRQVHVDAEVPDGGLRHRAGRRANTCQKLGVNAVPTGISAGHSRSGRRPVLPLKGVLV